MTGYVIKKIPVPKKGATVCTKACNALLPILLVCIPSYLEVSSEIKILNFVYLPSRHYIYLSKYERIRGYFSKLKE